MQVERNYKLAEKIENMSAEDVVQTVPWLLADPEVTKITITPNRHDRRREKAKERKKRNGVKK